MREKESARYSNLKSDGSASGVSSPLKNGLESCVDWLAFTVTDSFSVQQVIEWLGFDFMQFSQAPRGAMGYKSMYRLDGHPVSVLFDGADNMGIHVNISGSAVGCCVAAYRRKLQQMDDLPEGSEDVDMAALRRFLSDIMEIGHITRLDLAVDDKGDGQYFTCTELEKYLQNGNVVSKFRKWHTDIDYRMGGGIIGYTIYLGSRKSDCFLRIYDKRLEQEAKRQKQEEKCPEIPHDDAMSVPPQEEKSEPWTRWEFELKDERAAAAARMLVAGGEIGTVVVGVLANYFRIIEFTDENRSRCAVLPKWAAFIDGVESIRLYVPEEPKNLDDKLEWIDKQVLPTVVGLVLAFGTLDFIEDNIDRGMMRIKSDLWEQIIKVNPDAAAYRSGK